MDDIVDDALERRGPEREDEQGPDEFGEPRFTLLGYGAVGAEIVRQGWDSRYPRPEHPDADVHRTRGAGELPAGVEDADYVVLTGGTADRGVAAAIGETLADGTTSIAVPVRTTGGPVGPVPTVDATLPCDRDHVRGLATDLLTVLTGRIEISPPPRSYRELRSIGRVYGFRGQRDRNGPDTSVDEFADRLVADALANPVDAVDHEGTEHYLSLLRAGDDLTLREADAVRAEIAAELDVGARSTVLAVDATEGTGTAYRLTVLCA